MSPGTGGEKRDVCASNREYLAIWKGVADALQLGLKILSSRHAPEVLIDDDGPR